MGRLVWAAQHIIWRHRHPEVIEAPHAGLEHPITFESLGFKSPNFQYTILTNFASRVNEALDSLNEGAEAKEAAPENTPSASSETMDFMGGLVDDF